MNTGFLQTRAAQIIVQFSVYFTLALIFLWDALPADCVPGANRSDVWNALWSLSWFAESIMGGSIPIDAPLNHPHGGRLWIADVVNGIIMIPLLMFFDIGSAYTFLCVLLSALLGWGMHQWALSMMPKRQFLTAFAAGASVQISSIALSAVHNGSSEAMSGCWLVLALWQLWMLGHRKSGQYIRTSVLLIIAVLSSWYTAVLTVIFGLGICLTSPIRKHWSLWWPLTLSTILSVPVAWWAVEVSSGASNIVRIKGDAVLEQVRRSIGVADPIGYFLLGYQSPDFRFISRFGENFIHSTYLGISVVFLAILGSRYAPKWIWGVGLTCLFLSLGPVLVIQSEPVIFWSDHVMPLPYFLLEWLPGFDRLSLLFRFALGLQIALALLLVFNRWTSRVWVVLVGAILVESSIQAHILGFPAVSHLPEVSAAQKLNEAPEGGVMLYPHVAARPFLFWQRVHKKSIAASLNFPVNAAAQRVWKTAREMADASDSVFKQKIRQTAQQRKIRYIFIVHDATAMPDINRQAVERIKQTFGIYASDTAGDVVRLW